MCYIVQKGCITWSGCDPSFLLWIYCTELSMFGTPPLFGSSLPQLKFGCNYIGKYTCMCIWCWLLLLLWINFHWDFWSTEILLPCTLSGLQQWALLCTYWYNNTPNNTRGIHTKEVPNCPWPVQTIAFVSSFDLGNSWYLLPRAVTGKRVTSIAHLIP